MSKFPSQEMDRFNVRLPSGMRDAIAQRAEKNGRSMNSEIVQILSDAISAGDGPTATIAKDNKFSFKLKPGKERGGADAFKMVLGEDGVITISGNVDEANEVPEITGKNKKP